jgi:hypothetical protein
VTVNSIISPLLKTIPSAIKTFLYLIKSIRYSHFATAKPLHRRNSNP